MLFSCLNIFNLRWFSKYIFNFQTINIFRVYLLSFIFSKPTIIHVKSIIFIKGLIFLHKLFCIFFSFFSSFGRFWVFLDTQDITFFNRPYLMNWWVYPFNRRCSYLRLLSDLPRTFNPFMRFNCIQIIHFWSIFFSLIKRRTMGLRKRISSM